MNDSGRIDFADVAWLFNALERNGTPPSLASGSRPGFVETPGDPGAGRIGRFRNIHCLFQHMGIYW